MILDNYKNVAPQGAVEFIRHMAKPLKKKTMLHVNSTRWGGGVAEMLHRLIPIFQELDIDTRWEVIEGSALFYQTTKAFHNALQGNRQEVITQEMYNEYLKINKKNMRKIDFNSEFVVIHDPQPAAMIKKRNKKSSWLWRCHIDISQPRRNVWYFLRDFVNKYQGVIFSLPGFAQKLSVPQFLVYPSIDPLSDKNRPLTEKEITTVRQRFNLPEDKPIILQVSRFDKFKDPIGVIEAYKMVKAYNDCCLVLAGGGAADDPEGDKVLAQIKDIASSDKDIFILDLPPNAHLEINALQRIADIIVQKSIKEGFGLTVAEGMWKGKPVIGGAVGGITVQIIYGVTGFTVNSVEGCAYRIRYLLNNPEISQQIGQNAKEYVRHNFLITRHICDYLALMRLFTKV